MILRETMSVICLPSKRVKLVENWWGCNYDRLVSICKLKQ